jgi:hypothetical protein
MIPQISPSLLNFVRPSAHSKFSPSAADAWLACPGRARLIEGIPVETSVYAEEGTLAHSVCEAVFRQEMYGIEFPIELNMELAKLEDQGAEIIDCAYNYYNVVTSWLNDEVNVGKVLYFGLERGVPVYPERGCFGTADCLIVGTNGAVIIDYKHGKGKNVGAQSLQLKVYLAGIYLHLAGIPEHYRFHSVVVQPRTDTAAKTHSYSIEEIKDFTNVIWKAITASEDPYAQPVEGNHCFWCPAKRTHDVNKKCPIIKEKPLKLAQENFGKFLAQMEQNTSCVVMPGEELASNKLRDEAMLKILAIAPLIAKVAEDSEAEILARIESGEQIEGVTIVHEPGRRKLNADTIEDAEKLLTPHFPGLKVSKTVTKTSLRSITEIEKELGKGKLDPFCVRPLKKKIQIFDDKIRGILKEMRAYSLTDEA